MRSGSRIPDDTQEFIQRYISSIIQLEVLLFLAERDSQDCTATQVSDELRSETTLVSAALGDLHRSGMLTRISGTDRETEAGYRFAPADGTLQRQVEILGILFRQRRYSVTTLIYEHSSS